FSNLETREIFISAHISKIVDALIGRSRIGDVESHYRNTAADRLVQDRLESLTVQDRDRDAVRVGSDRLVQDRDETLQTVVVRRKILRLHTGVFLIEGFHRSGQPIHVRVVGPDVGYHDEPIVIALSEYCSNERGA